MTTIAGRLAEAAVHPVEIRIEPALTGRDRLTTGFRLLLALPHLLLVGGPIALTLSFSSTADTWLRPDWGIGGGGALGVVAALCAIIAWFAIVFNGRYPEGLEKLARFYLRWRVRAVSYVALLRDEYPPFGDGEYPVELDFEPLPADAKRDRLTVAFRLVLAIPHLLIVWVLGVAWALSTLIAWFAILFTGRYPEGLYGFAVGVLRWNTRVEAYLLLLHDEYPPFRLEN
jgi:hypothetical protein